MLAFVTVSLFLSGDLTGDLEGLACVAWDLPDVILLGGGLLWNRPFVPALFSLNSSK